MVEAAKTLNIYSKNIEEVEDDTEIETTDIRPDFSEKLSNLIRKSK